MSTFFKIDREEYIEKKNSDAGKTIMGRISLLIIVMINVIPVLIRHPYLFIKNAWILSIERYKKILKIKYNL